MTREQQVEWLTADEEPDEGAPPGHKTFATMEEYEKWNQDRATQQHTS